MSRVLHSKTYVALRRMLADARREAALTQVDLAAKLDRPQSFVSKYENGERHLDVVEFIEVCAALGVRPGQILDSVVEETRQKR